MFGCFGWLRYYKDDNGRTIVERGFDQVAPWARGLLVQSATSGAFFAIIALNIIPVNLHGFYADPYPELPASLINGMCNSPGVEGTSYGPCPGSRGFQMPVRSGPADSWTDPTTLRVSPSLIR
jgi:hypothetical protein